jgi:hypothetical protein
MKRGSPSHHYLIEEFQMTRKFRILATAILTLSLQFSYAVAQDERGTQELLEKAEPRSDVPALAIKVTPTPAVIRFNPAAVGIPAASAQKLTAKFNISGYTGSFTPTATLHYGHDYTLGTLTCVVSGNSGNSETCSVTVSFIPTLPGGRKDALLLKDGATTLVTVLVAGTGQSPLALIQPGIVTSPISNASYNIYQSVVDENGTVYFLADGTNAVYSYTKAGILTELPISGLNSPHALDIDGAGTLYIAQNAFGTDIVTYTTDGVQGTITVVPPAPPYVPCSKFEYLYSVAVDQTGNLFVLETECSEIFVLKANGTYLTTAIDPSITQPSEIALDASDNLFIGGYDINKLTAGGLQTQINTVGAPDGVPPDAADTVYATRYTGFGGVVELPASDYTTPIATLDPAASPLGDSVGSDGTVYVGNNADLDKVDRSQGAIAFGEQQVNVKSPAEDVSIYNGGNQPLTLSNFTRSGASAFALETAATTPCKKGMVIAPGAYCQVAFTMTAPHAGIFSGTVTFISDSLNATSKTQTVALSGFVYGVYVTASPTLLTFPSQTVGTTSAAKPVTLTNQGDRYSAEFGTPVAPSGFNVGLGTCTGLVAVGASCKLSVTFSPTEAQAYSGTVTIPVGSNGGGITPSVKFEVSGNGVAAAALTPAKQTP